MRFTNPLKAKVAAALLVALCATFVAPAFAGAQNVDPTTGQYEDQLTQINAGAQPPSDNDSGGLNGRVGPLPFTGFDVIAMAVVALAVAGLGLALQRAVTRDPHDGIS